MLKFTTTHYTLGRNCQLEKVNTTDSYPAGTVVSYGDNANPYQEFIVTSGEIEGFGQTCINRAGTWKTEVSPQIVDGLGGWSLVDKDKASTAEILTLIDLYNEYRESQRQVGIARDLERATTMVKNKAILDKLPATTKALIVAYYVQDECELELDYHGSSCGKTVVLATSKHTRNLFPEMRKAAKTFEPTKYLATVGEDAEHRENHSMGGGTYLKDGYRHNSGWKIRKEPVKWFNLSDEIQWEVN